MLGKVPESLPAPAGFAVELSGVRVPLVSFGKLGASGCDGVLGPRRAGLDVLEDVLGELCVAEGERRAQRFSAAFWVVRGTLCSRCSSAGVRRKLPLASGSGCGTPCARRHFA